MQNLVQVMKALSDASRVSILMMLRKREMCACEITPLLGLAQPTVSRHLKVLKDAGLILARREGIWVNYRLPEEPENQLVAALLNGLPCWLGEDPALRSMLERMGPDNPCAVASCEAIACGKSRGKGSKPKVEAQPHHENDPGA